MTLSQQFPELMLPVKVIPLTQGKFVIVDPEDYETVMATGPWYAARNGRNWYAGKNVTIGRDDQGRRMRHSLKMHTLITGFSLVDHINRNGLDNRRLNLREATRSLNNRNRSLQSNNTSGWTGVQKSHNRWRAVINFQGKRHLGCYDTPEEAYAAYLGFARENGLLP